MAGEGTTKLHIYRGAVHAQKCNFQKRKVHTGLKAKLVRYSMRHKKPLVTVAPNVGSVMTGLIVVPTGTDGPMLSCCTSTMFTQFTCTVHCTMCMYMYRLVGTDGNELLGAAPGCQGCQG